MGKQCEHCAFNRDTIACMSFLLDEAFQQTFYPNEPQLVCKNFIERILTEDVDNIDVSEII